MASVSLNLDISANGLKGLVELSNQFNKNMQAGAEASKQAGGTTSSRNLASNTPTSSYAAAKAENTGYNTLRAGTSAGTGSATSDFARQAQGLGGLVHLYATFAANIFAAEAAFKALSEAMNTAHLVQGLDQLSAQSGKALGSLAKQLTNATDGAISFKEAMTSTANASAAGMTNDQILKMGEVAKKASQALGWDMADAMDRLTKGISKNRPQLLDELGILVNANTIYGDYAKSVGKSTASLTDFEKKQAFANAVLKQGLDKFSAIDIPTNPFTKLEASMTNIAQASLGLVDKILGPIVKILAESPTALAAVMAGIAGILVSKALPALGAWREGLAAAAASSASAAKKIHDNFEAFDIGRKLDIGGELAKKATAAANDAVAGVQTALGKAFTGKSSLLASAMSGSYDAAAAQKSIDTQTKAAASKLSSLQEQRLLIEATDTEHLLAMDKDIAKQSEKLDQLKQAAMYNKVAAQEQKIANDIMNSAEAKAAMAPGFGSEAWQRQQIANRAVAKAQSNAIMSNVGSNTQNMGVSAAFSNLKDDIKNGAKILDEAGNTIGRVEGKLGTLATGMAYAGGTMRILGAAATTAISAFMPWIMAITIAITIFEAFDSVMSKATEQQSIFNDATTTNTANVKVAADAVAYLADKSKNMYSLEGITSMANAIGGVTDALHNQIKAYDDLQAKSGIWDNIKDSISKLWGGSNLNKLTDSISKDVPAALNTLVLSSQSAAAKADIGAILKIKPESTLSIQAVEAALEKFSGPERVAKIRELSDALANISMVEQNSASAIKAFSDSLGVLDKEVDVVINKLQFTDGPGKLGVELVDSAHKMAEALKDPIKGLTSLQKLAGDAKGLSLLPPKAVDSLITMKSDLDDLVTTEVNLKKQIEANNKAIEVAKSTSPKRGGTSATSGLTATATDLNSKLDQLQIKIKKTVDDSAGVVLDIYKAGAEEIQLGLKNALASASLVMAKADLSIAAAAGLNTASQDASIKLQELEIQKKNVLASFELQKRILENTEKLEIANEYKAIEIALAQKSSGKSLDDKVLDATAIGVLDKTILSAAASIREISISRSIRGGNKDVSTLNTQDVTNAKNRNTPFDLNDVQKAAAVAGINAQEYAVIQAKKLAIEDEITKSIQNQNKLALDQNNLDLLSINSLQAQVGGYSQLVEDAKTINLVDKARLDYISAITPLLNTQAKLALVTHPKDTKDYDQKKLDNANALNDALDKFQKTEISINDDAGRKKFVQDQKTIADNIALSVSNLDNYITIKTASLTLDSQDLSNKQALGEIDEKSFIHKKASIDLDIQSMKYAKENLIASTAISSALEEQKQITILMSKSDRPEAFSIQADAAKIKVQLALDHKNALDKANDSAVAGIKATEEQNLKLVDQKDHLQDITNIGTVLTEVFGDVGKSLGTMVSSMDAFGINSKKRAKELENMALTDKERNSLQAKQAAAEVEDYASITGAFKEMFDKKSKAYQLFANYEKALHLASMGMKVAEMVMGNTATAASVANSATEDAASITSATISGGEAVLNQAAKGDPYSAIPRMIAMGAMVAAVLASIGGSGGEVGGSTGPSAADIQKSQLTGQTYDSTGTLKDTGYGALGDQGANLKGIQDGVDALGKVFFNTMGSNSSMLLTHLRGIQTNTAQTVTALLKTINGGQGLNATVVLPPETSSSIAGSFIKGLDMTGQSVAEQFLAASLANIATSVGSQSKTYSGVDSQALQLSGTSKGFAAGTGTGQYATTISTQHDVGAMDSLFGGGSSYKSVQTLVDKLDTKVMNKISLIFKDFNESMLVVADGLGVSTDTMNKALEQIPINMNIDIKGLTGTQIADVLGAQITLSMNEIITKTIPWITEYQKLGEEVTATAARLIKDSETVATGLSMIGKSVVSTSMQLTVANNEQLISNFGGSIDQFATAMQGYSDSMLTDSEKATFAMANVNKSLNTMGLSSITTKDQFKAYVNTLDPLSQKFADIIQLAPEFGTAVDALDAVAKAAKTAADNLAATKLDQTIKIYDLLGNAEASLALQRQKELDALDESLKPNQRYIYALQDEAAIRAKLNTSITSTITSLKASIKTLKDYQLTLAMGSNSVLDPTQKYQQSKQTLADLEALISGPATTDAQKQAQADAVSKFPAASDAFLNASKVLFSSSAQYTQDFQTVSDFVTTSAAALTAQQSDAEKQLQILTDSATSLGIIATASQTTADLLIQYMSAVSKVQTTSSDATLTPIPAHANGGMAFGVSLVGERGPELVDFSTPSRVYSNKNTKGLLDNSELIAEIKALRAEVAALRADQQEQTGHIISTNYEANIKAADKIAGATQDAAATTTWGTRSAPTIM